MAVYPGATFKPTTWGGKVARNRQGRGILHVAVSERVSYPPNSGNTWHFYIAKAAPNGATDGSGGPAYCEQYVDTAYRAYGDVDANDDAIVIETAGGMGTSAQLNAEKWTRAQELRIADIMRWESRQPGGAPLQLLPDSRAGRTGWGPHRLGIKHSAGLVPGWWAPGGEVWSTSLGKECPGTAKINQIPGIINEARTGSPQEDDMQLTDKIKLWSGETITLEQLFNGLFGRVADLHTGELAPGPVKDIVQSWYGPRFRNEGPDDKVGRNFAQVLHNIEDQAVSANNQITGLTVAFKTLAEVVVSGRDDLTAEELTAAVDEGIQRGGAAVLAAQEAARAAAAKA